MYIKVRRYGSIRAGRRGLEQGRGVILPGWENNFCLTGGAGPGLAEQNAYCVPPPHTHTSRSLTESHVCVVRFRGDGPQPLRHQGRDRGGGGCHRGGEQRLARREAQADPCVVAPFCRWYLSGRRVLVRVFDCPVGVACAGVKWRQARTMDCCFLHETCRLDARKMTTLSFVARNMTVLC